MADHAKANHARIFTSDPVQFIADDNDVFLIESGEADVLGIGAVERYPRELS
jgi:hypothetical protein